MIVVIGGVKGGTGKTTIATNLTVMRSSLGKRVLLVDADEQQSSCNWSTQRQSEGILTSFVTIPLKDKAVKTEVLKLKSNFDDIIIDVGATNTSAQRASLLIADTYVIPFGPRSLDIWTLGLVKNLIDEASIFNEKLISISVINRADPIGNDNQEAMDILKENIYCLPFFIGQRKSFANAASAGISVTEIKKNHDVKASNEIIKIHNNIYSDDIKMISL